MVPHDETWLKAVFALWGLIMFWGFVLMTADVVHAFRTDWIHS